MRKGGSQTVPQMAYLDVRFVQFKCFTSVCQSVPIALCLEVCKAAITIIHCHGGVEIDCLGVEVDGLVKLVICPNIQYHHNTCVVALIKISVCKKKKIDAGRQREGMKVEVSCT